MIRGIFQLILWFIGVGFVLYVAMFLFSLFWGLVQALIMGVWAVGRAIACRVRG